MRKKLCTLLLAIVASTGIYAANVVTSGYLDGVEYTLYDDLTASVTGYEANLTTANISEIVYVTTSDNKYAFSVTSIGNYAFSYCSSLTSVTIPNSVTSIGAYAFNRCSSLSSVTIGNSVTSIGGFAFENCTGLTSVTIGNSVTSIGVWAFCGCESLTSVHISDITAWCNIAFGDHYSNPLCYANNLYLNGKLVTDLVIPNSVTSIGVWAFYGCSSLTSVTIPNSVTSIGDRAFVGCSGLTSVTIGNSVTSIGDEAFCGCESLTSVTIGNSVTSIGGSAFSGCSGLTSVTIPNSVTSIGDGAFYGCSGLTSVTIGNSVTSIGNYAFSHCSGLTSVTIGNSVISIGGSAFYECRNLTSVTIPNSVTSIGDRAFYGCPSLTGELVIPNSVTSIGSSAFSYCSLTSVTIPNSVTSIGDHAFAYCHDLTSVTIPNSVTSIGDGAFYCCSGLTSIVVENGNSVYDSRNNCNALIETATNTLIAGCQNTTIPNSVTSIGNYAFYNCCGLTSVTIPNSVTSIGNEAFCSCCGLTSVTIPNSVTSIGNEAFSDCNVLTSVTINSNEITSKTYTAESTICSIFGTQVKEYILGNDITGVGANAFNGCTGLKKLILGDNISSYGENAFAGCSNLTSIYNYRERPAKLGNGAFNGVDYFNCTLYVLAGSVDMYKSTGSDWKDFYFIEPIGTTETTVTENKVTVSPADNTALFTWQMSEDASTYTLQITKDGVVFCTLVFGADGSLKGIAFAPGRNGQSHAPAAMLTANGMQFTVTGLDAASKYAYRLAVADAQNNEIIAYSGEFATNGYEGEVNPGGNPEGIDEVPSDQVPSTKVLRNGQIFILRGEKVYTVTGQEVK